jgi:hypothetical protein
MILSRKKILDDFEHEWAKIWNTFLVDIAAGSGLRPVTVQHFTQSKKIVYLFPKNDLVSGGVTISRVVEVACAKFGSFVIDPNVRCRAETTPVNEQFFLLQLQHHSDKTQRVFISSSHFSSLYLTYGSDQKSYHLNCILLCVANVLYTMVCCAQLQYPEQASVVAIL